MSRLVKKAEEHSTALMALLTANQEASSSQSEGLEMDTLTLK